MQFEPEGGWRSMADALVSGITHDLNGRLTALIGLAHLARASGTLEDELLEVLDQQIERLNASIVHLRSLPLRRTPPELLRLSDAVQEAVDLFRCRSGADVTRVAVEANPADSPVVRAPASELREALLLLIGVMEHGVNGGPPRPVRITVGLDGQEGVVRIARADASSGSRVSDAAKADGAHPPEAVIEADRLLQGMGGQRRGVALAGNVVEVRLRAITGY